MFETGDDQLLVYICTTAFAVNLFHEIDPAKYLRRDSLPAIMLLYVLLLLPAGQFVVPARAGGFCLQVFEIIIAAPSNTGNSYGMKVKKQSKRNTYRLTACLVL